LGAVRQARAVRDKAVCRATDDQVRIGEWGDWVVGWLGGWVVGGLGGWVVGWLGGWVVGGWRLDVGSWKLDGGRWRLALSESLP
jgi:hypothetical protein